MDYNTSSEPDRNSVFENVHDRLLRIYSRHLHTAAERVGIADFLRWAYEETVVASAADTVTHEIAGVSVSFPQETHWQYTTFHGEYDESDVIADLVPRLHNDDVVLDVGAYLGWISTFAATAVTEGQVIAVEPHPETAQQLQEVIDTTGHDNIKIFKCALNNEFNEIRFSDRNSSEAYLNDANATTTVSTMPGDELIERVSGPHPTVVKIDIEGAEFEALQGLRETLTADRCRLLYCEVHNPDKLAKFGSTAEDVLKLINSYGFETKLIKSNKRNIYRAKK